MGKDLAKILKDYSTIYQRIKRIIIMSENLDPKNEVYLAPMNEFRSTLDHIFKAASDDENCERELVEAKNHLLRAGYDSYEILIINLIVDITDNLNRYDSTTISAVFPEYYQDTKQALLDIKLRLSNIRLSKRIVDADFKEFEEQVNTLLQVKSKVDERIPFLEAFEKGEKVKSKRRLLKRYLIDIIIGLIAATIGMFLFLIIKK